MAGRGRGGNALGGTTWFGGPPQAGGARRPIIGENTASVGPTSMPLAARLMGTQFQGTTSTAQSGGGAGAARRGGGGSSVSWGGMGGGRSRGGSGGGSTSSGQRTPTFLNSDAYYAARGSGLDWLEQNGPNRGSQQGGGSQLAPATYGGRAAVPAAQGNSATQTVSGDRVIDFASGQNLPAPKPTTSPYTELTGDAVTGPIDDTTPQGRYNRMAMEQQMAATEGLEEGRAAAAQVRQQQALDAAGGPQVERTPTGSFASSKYGLGSYYPTGGGLQKSFGRTGAASPQQSRQDDLGDAAIAAVQRRNPSATQGSLLQDYYRRFGRK